MVLVSDALLLSDVEVDPNGEVVESVDAFVTSEVIVDTYVVKLIAAEEAVVIDVLVRFDVVANPFEIDSNGTILASDTLV